MPINVGDAVLTFVGDTTQLDQAFAKVETDAQAKVAPATMQVEQLGQAWNVAGSEALRAGESAAIAGAETQAAAEKMSFSMAEAKGTMALAGEEIGVKIPRHLRTFIAELPGVGAAMEAAFSAVALFVLVDVIVQATKKLTEFISTTFIYTEAMKEEYAAQVQLNQALVTHAEKMAELKKAYDYLGLEGVAKTRKEITDLSDSITKNEAKWNANEIAAAGYRAELQKLEIELEKTANDQAMLAGEPGLASDGPQNRIKELKAQIDSLRDANTKLNLDLEEQRKQQVNKNKELNAQELADRIKHGEATVAAEKTVADANVAVLQAQSALRLSHLKVAYLEEAVLTSQGEEALYQIKLKAKKEERANAALDPTKNVDKITTLNSEIEALEQGHLAKSLTAQASYWSTLREVTAGGVKTVSSVISEMIPLDKTTEEMDKLEATLQQFGIISASAWQKEIEGAQEAYDEAVRLGATYEVLIQIKKRLVSGELGKALSVGDREAASQLRNQVRSINAEMERLGLTVEKFRKGYGSAIADFGKFTLSVRDQGRELSKLKQEFDNVTADISNVFGHAVSQWILSQESLGIALRKGLAEYLAVYAEKAAIDALYFLAWGIADTFWNPTRAGADFAAAAEFAVLAAVAGGAAYGINPKSSSGGGSSSASSGPTPTGQAATGGPTGPTTGVNVQHFAKGGLVMSPTLAVIGDAINGAASSGAGQREAAIPLDDPEATGAIADAIGGRGGTTNHYHIQGVISSDMMDKVIDKINERTGSGKVLIATKARRVEKK